MEERDINQRFVIFLNDNEIKPADIAKALMVIPQRIQDWKNGIKPIPTIHLMRLCELYPNLNARWLLIGQGDMQDREGIEVIIKEPIPEYKKNCAECDTKDIRIRDLSYHIDNLRKALDLLDCGKKGEANCG